jgi:hypothetical protein
MRPARRGADGAPKPRTPDCYVNDDGSAQSGVNAQGADPARQGPGRGQRLEYMVGVIYLAQRLAGHQVAP